MKYFEHIELSLEETIQAIEEGKKKKYFREKHKEYWERLKPPKGEIEERIIPSRSRIVKKECISI